MTNVDILERFSDECVFAKSIRDQYAELYEAGERRKALLAEVANLFFGDLNAILQEYIILQICKLTDPAHSGRGGAEENLTSNRILEFGWPAMISTELAKHNDVLLAFRKKVIEGRRKVIAHADLKSFMSQVIYGGFTPSEEVAFWTALESFVNTASMHLKGDPFEIGTAAEGGAGALVSSLRDAVDYNDLVESNNAVILDRLGHTRYEDA